MQMKSKESMNTLNSKIDMDVQHFNDEIGKEAL